MHKVLGYGSFSCVCLATDNATGERVALKRIGDVMQSLDHAKRVLREIAILRRVSHPNLICLRDAFVRPSATGQCRMVGGRLVHTSIDLYLALEYADGGDLFHMRGQLSAEEATSLLWQLLQALAYLHSMNVWHRDVKSQNAFITWDSGVRVVKLGDFGSARSAIAQGGGWNGGSRGDGSSGPIASMHTADSFKEMDAAMQSSDLYCQLDNDSEQEEGAIAAGRSGRSLGSKSVRQLTSDSGRGLGQGFKAPLTRVVATPCYRAPEVVMSRGNYNAGIDMWGAGCIFGELLHRVAYVGSAATPHLQVAPLFAIRGMPKTPQDGETFGQPECAGTRRELQALFDVVGTPAWRDAAAVEMPEWRAYLARLPGKAPSLHRKFKSAGEVAVHLLSRLLEFDPGRRATCEEALSHELFGPLREDIEREHSGAVPAAAGVSTATDGGLASMHIDGDRFEKDYVEEEMAMARSESLAVAAAAAAATWNASTGAPAAPPPPAEGLVGGRGRHYWEEQNPGRALALLEQEMEEIVVVGSRTDPMSEASQRLRYLLEEECKAAAAAAQARRAAGPSAASMPTPSKPQKDAAKYLDVFRRSAGLQEDTAAGPQGGKDYGRERLSNVADTWQGRELDPRKFLGPQRHGEWTAHGGGGGPAPGPRWGVTAVPPGLAGLDPRVQAIVRKQQER